MIITRVQRTMKFNKGLLNSAIIGSKIRCFATTRGRQRSRHMTRNEEIVLEHLIKRGPMTRVRSQQLADEGTSRSRNPLWHYVHVVSDP